MAHLTNGLLTISLTTNKQQWHLSVQDNGTGMAPHVLPHIFEPFFTTKAVGEGSGLGLSSVAGLISEIGATIKVDSTVGHSTCFIIEGAVHHHSSDVPRAFSDIHTQPLKNKAVLYVDDEVGLHTAMHVQLADWGANFVHCLPNGQAALLWQDDNPNQMIDLLISDVVMPQMSGVKLVELFTSLRPSTTAILISGYPQHASLPRLDSGKTTKILQKPVPPDILKQACYEVLA